MAAESEMTTTSRESFSGEIFQFIGDLLALFTFPPVLSLGAREPATQLNLAAPIHSSLCLRVAPDRRALPSSAGRRR